MIAIGCLLGVAEWGGGRMYCLIYNLLSER
jgi:hypothetical protein